MDNKANIGFEFMFPSYSDDMGLNAPAFGSYLYSDIPLSDTWTLQLDLPISHFTNGGGEANAAIGNPYVGFEYGDVNAATKFDFGVRFLAAGQYQVALNAGLTTENYKIGAFALNAFSVVSNIHYRAANESGLIYRLGGGPEVLIGSGDGAGGTRVFVKYYGQLLYKINDITFGGGLNGRVFAGASGGSFSDRALHNAALSASYDFGKISVGTYVELPLDDRLGNFLNAVVRVNFRIYF